MGLFDFFRRIKGIPADEFNTPNFQAQACALAWMKLKESNFNPQVAIKALLKIGLNKEQAAIILERTQEFVALEKQSNGFSDSDIKAAFKDETYLQEILAYTQDVYFHNNHSYDVVRKELAKKGLDNRQVELIIVKHEAIKEEMVKDFREKVDSAIISEIKLTPNPEHTKGSADKDQVDKYIGFGAYQIERGDLDNALELLDKAIEIDENATLAYANKGSLFAKKGEQQQALWNYNKALELEPAHAQILENKMDLLVEMIQDEQSERDFIDTVKALLKQDPDHFNALIYMTQFHLKEPDIPAALLTVKRLFSNYYTEDISIHLMLSVFGRLSEEEVMAQFDVFEKETNPKALYQLRYNKGLYLKGIGKYEAAIHLYEDLNEMQEFAWNYYQMGIMKNLQGKTEECLVLLNTTFRLDPTLKEDAKNFPELQNLWSLPSFIYLTK